MDPNNGISWRDLASAESGRPAQAAESLYASPDRASIFGNKDAAHALIQSAEKGNRSAAAILLLGYAEGAADVLKRIAQQHAEEPVKLASWSRTVPLRVAASVALSRAGDSEARRSILEHASEYPDNVRVFLLDALKEIDAPEILHALSQYMKDETEIPEGVPSGAARRRVADHAVDAFIDALSLPVTFERNPGGRYSQQQIDETQRLLRENVPR
jgi:hypothetical protein